SEMPMVPPTNPSVALALVQDLSVYTDAPGALVPGYFAGWANPSDPKEFPVVLAIAVNGIVRSVTRTYDFRDPNDPTYEWAQNRWEFILPESAFKRGPNRIEYYVVRGEGSNLKLQPVRN